MDRAIVIAVLLLVGLTWGMAVLVALLRGFARRQAKQIGNFYVHDFARPFAMTPR